MNFNKVAFTVDKFLSLPVHEFVSEAKVGVPFLLKGRMSSQADYLKNLVEEKTVNGLRQQLEDEKIRNPKADNRLKFFFWKKLKDGNVQDVGGHIIFPKETSVITQKGDKLVIETNV